MKDLLNKYQEDLVQILKDTVINHGQIIREIALEIAGALKAGGKLLLCGNGGSAADCQHLAAEFVNRFRMERRPLPAVALTTDTSVLTSIANDYSFAQVFEKQVAALGKTGDVLIGISTSGTSENVVRALEAAGRKGLVAVGFTGMEARDMSGICDYLVKVRSKDTPRIQEVHIFLGHVICDMAERIIFENELS